MSDRDNKEDIIRNPETRRRRAWIERALEGVRRRLDSEEGIPESSEPAPRPRLYVVRSARRR